MKRILLSLAVCTFAYANVDAQSYIQLRQKSLSEEISPEFSFSITSSSFSSAVTLQDRPDAISNIFAISGDQDGGMFAIAGTGEYINWDENPGNIYYRASESGQWIDYGVEAFRIAGIENGGYISLQRSADAPDDVNSFVADQINFKENEISAATNITANLDGELFLDVASNYEDWLYVLVYDTNQIGTIYKKTLTDVNWTSTGISGVNSVTALPGTNQIVYSKHVLPNVNEVFIASNDGTGVVSWGSPIPLWPNDMVEDVVVTYDEDGELNLWALSEALIYRSQGASAGWVRETGINDMRLLASTGSKMLSSVLFDGSSSNIPRRIFHRTQGGLFLDDERVQTSFKSNTVNIPVAPGTYTISQTPTSGWHLTRMKVYETDTVGTTMDLAADEITVVVSVDEVVVVEFENQLTHATSLDTICGGATFVEDFSSYSSGVWGNPLEGKISYHKATGNFGYGYYAIVSSTDALSYGVDMYDHTSGDASGAMLVVDATFENGTFYRRRFTDLKNGARYNFGAWIANYNPPAADKPNVSFQVYNADGVLLSEAHSGDVLTSEWQNFNTVFDSDGSDIEIVLRNNTYGTAGNDLVIDDISFGVTIPEPSVVTSFDCLSNQGTITITSPLSIPLENNYEYSIDGITWQTSTQFEGVSSGSYSVQVRFNSSSMIGCESSSTINLLGDCVSIAGNIWNDADGDAVTDAGELAVSGDMTEISGSTVSSGMNIWVNLVDENNQVVSSVQVNADGSYEFDNANNNTSYSLIVTTEEQIVGTELTSSILPANWTATGTNDPVNGVDLTNTDLVIDLGVLTGDIAYADFGMQRPPLADPKEFEVENSAFSDTPPNDFPSIPGYLSIAATSPSLVGYPTGGSLTGSDPEDCPESGECNTGTNSTFTIESINANTKVYYNFGTEESPDIQEIIVGVNNTIANFDVTKLTIYGEEGTGTSADPIGFTYSHTDKAGTTSSPAPYSITTSNPLVVSLVEFTVQKLNSATLLNWVTVSEENNKGFEIEHSSEGGIWKGIGFVQSLAQGGHSTVRLEYQFLDQNPTVGQNYYRLRQIDFNGKYSYSEVREIWFSPSSDINVYPNPAQENITISGLVVGDEIVVYNVLGQQVRTVTAQAHLEVVPMEDLVDGTYYVQVSGKAGRSTTHKIVKRK